MVSSALHPELHLRLFEKRLGAGSVQQREGSEYACLRAASGGDCDRSRSILDRITGARVQDVRVATSVARDVSVRIAARRECALANVDHANGAGVAGSGCLDANPP